MDLVKYAKGVKSFNKSEILESILLQQGMLNSLTGMLTVGKNNEVSLESFADRWALTKGILRDINRRGSVFTVEGILDQGITASAFLLKKVEEYAKTLNDGVDGRTLTVKQANMLSIIDMINFWTSYSIEMLSALTNMAYEAKDPEKSKYTEPEDLRFLNKTWSYYADLSHILCTEAQSVSRNFTRLSEVPVDETALDVLARNKGVQSVKAVPVRDFGVHQILPMFWYGKAKKEFDLRRIKSLTKTIEQHSMKLEQLMNRRGGAEDPKLDRQIEIYQNAIIKAKAAIEELDGRYLPKD